MHAVLRPVLLLSLVLALAACKREADVPASGAPAQEAAPVETTPAAAAVRELKDVIETQDSYIVGISYPPGLDKYPGLAQAVSCSG